jgi:hypothetical protein
MGHVASVCMIIRVYGKTLVLWPTTMNARAGSQSTIHPMLTGRPRARATYRTHGPRWADRKNPTGLVEEGWKLRAPWMGPYRIMDKLGPVSYVLKA